MNCFRYLGKQSEKEAKALTPREYSLMIQAVQLKRVDREYEIHLSAWMNQQVQATKKRGKKTVPIYKNFSEFFDYEGRVSSIIKPKKEEKELSKLEKIMLQANS